MRSLRSITLLLPVLFMLFLLAACAGDTATTNEEEPLEQMDRDTIEVPVDTTMGTVPQNDN